MLSKIINFLKTDIWRIRLEDLTRTKSFFLRQLRMVLVAFRGFDEDKCQLRASALTFYSLLSIVPIVALAFGIAKGFGLQNALERQLLEKFSGQEEVLTQVVGFAHSLLEKTRGGMVAGIGMILLLWSVLKVLSHIERSFNDIWGIKEQRSMGRKFSDYLSLMLICPVLVILSGSATVFITAQVGFIIEKISLLGYLSPIIYILIKLLPYCVIWLLFSFIYIFMPNTKVSFRSGILAGIIAGTIYQIIQWGYVAFQLGVAKYNAIYGSFAALPLFLIWLQLSWLVILFGAEISFAHQNVDTYEFEPDCLRISNSYKRLLSLRTANLIIKNFSGGHEPLTAGQVSHMLEIPVRLVRQILYELVHSRVISETRTEKNKEKAYQPAHDTDVLTVKFVLDALEQRGVDNLPVARSDEIRALSEALQTFNDSIEKSPANRLLKDI